MASSGNFCTWNPLDPIDSNITLSQGNTRSLCPASGYPETYGNFGMRSGKWYAEFYLDYVQGGSASYFAIGIAQQNAKLYTSTPGLGRTNTIIYLGNNGKTEKDGTVQSYGNTYGQGHIIGIAFDADNGKIYFSKNGTFQNSGNPANGTNPAYTSIDLTDDWFFSFTDSYNGQNGSLIINTGQDSTFGGNETAGGNADANGFGDFRYAPPTGFLALCSANLPISDDIDPAQTDDDFPQKQVNAVTYTGNASTRNITGVGFQPDLVITRGRSTASVGKVVDSSRGATKVLQTHSSSAESTDSNGLTAFGSDGYTLGSDAGYNNNSTTYVAYCWKANGGTKVSNSDGATTTTVQANTKAGFSIVECPQYTPNSTFGHGLNSAPTFIIAKTYEQGAQWAVYHSGLDSGKILYLSSNSAQFTSSIFNSTAPTSSVFSMGASYAGTGAIIAYCWHDVEGYSKFGKYEGNANADGAFIYTGFRIRILIIRVLNVASDGWLIYDTARETFNPLDTVLQPHLSSAEYSNSAFTLDILSNGFKLRSSDNAVNGTSYDPYIYMAWGDVPFKYNNTF